MEYYNKIFIWDCIKRINFLNSFKRNVVEYFDNIEYQDIGYGVTENKKAQQARSDINKEIRRAREFVLLAGISPFIYYSPPSAVGGLAGNIGLFVNIFKLYKFEVEPRFLIDMIEQAIGIYKLEKIKSFIRTINPLYWIWILFEWIVNLPFKLLTVAGFNTEKIEKSLAGKLAKFIFYLVLFFAAFLAILYYLGYLDIFKDWLKSLVNRG